MVDDTLTEIKNWFEGPGLSSDRTMMLSKLATIELCGWIEGEFDRLIMLVAQGRLSDENWLEKEVIKKTSGFRYDQHWRSMMLCKVVGEVFACRVEVAMEAAHPGELERLKALLERLWKDRCSFAHADLTRNLANRALVFNAPSLTIGLYEDLKTMLGLYEAVMISVMPPILAAPPSAPPA